MILHVILRPLIQVTAGFIFWVRPCYGRRHLCVDVVQEVVRGICRPHVRVSDWRAITRRLFGSLQLNAASARTLYQFPKVLELARGTSARDPTACL
jgi:3-methyladenine DNA glycosylase/8-oxoguanine DNA glycosylase